jgi:hypothetical protein
MRRVSGILWVACAVLLAGGVEGAGASSSSTDALPKIEMADPSPAQDDVERARWQKKAVDAYRGLAEARQRYDAAVARYSSLRSRNRDRGDVKVQAMKEKADAEEALAVAEERLESLSEDAHRAGIPPGWIRVFDEDWMSESEPASLP